MKTALILDDLQVRHDAFKQSFGQQYNIHSVYNFVEFFNYITQYPGTIDYVTLDHDLGDTHGHLYGTGMMAVNLLAILPDVMKPLFVNVHSHNLIRGEIMLDRLLNAGYKASYVHFTED
jgi:hypothetical protein